MGKSEMRWYISKRVLLVEHYGNITVETLRDVNAEMTQYLEDGDAPVHVISDSSQMDDFPTNVNQLRKTMDTLNDDRWGWMVAVGVNSMVRFLVAVMSSIFGLRIKTADSIEEAEKILRRVEPRIADAEVITAEAQTDEAAAASATVSDDTQTDETDSDEALSDTAAASATVSDDTQTDETDSDSDEATFDKTATTEVSSVQPTPEDTSAESAESEKTSSDDATSQEVQSGTD